MSEALGSKAIKIPWCWVISTCLSNYSFRQLWHGVYLWIAIPMPMSSTAHLIYSYHIYFTVRSIYNRFQKIMKLEKPKKIERKHDYKFCLFMQLTAAVWLSYFLRCSLEFLDGWLILTYFLSFLWKTSFSHLSTYAQNSATTAMQPLQPPWSFVLLMSTRNPSSLIHLKHLNNQHAYMLLSLKMQWTPD